MQVQTEKNEIQKIINTFREDLYIYAKNCLKIVNKQGRLIDFEFNEAQHQLDKQINEQYKKHGRVRILILKSRQTGISTYCQARGFWKTVSEKNQKALPRTKHIKREE